MGGSVGGGRGLEHGGTATEVTWAGPGAGGAAADLLHEGRDPRRQRVRQGHQRVPGLEGERVVRRVDEPISPPPVHRVPGGPRSGRLRSVEEDADLHGAAGALQEQDDLHPVLIWLEDLHGGRSLEIGAQRLGEAERVGERVPDHLQPLRRRGQPHDQGADRVLPPAGDGSVGVEGPGPLCVDGEHSAGGAEARLELRGRLAPARLVAPEEGLLAEHVAAGGERALHVGEVGAGGAEDTGQLQVRGVEFLGVRGPAGRRGAAGPGDLFAHLLGGGAGGLLRGAEHQGHLDPRGGEVPGHEGAEALADPAGADDSRAQGGAVGGGAAHRAGRSSTKASRAGT